MNRTAVGGSPYFVTYMSKWIYIAYELNYSGGVAQVRDKTKRWQVQKCENTIYIDIYEGKSTQSCNIYIYISYHIIYHNSLDYDIIVELFQVASTPVANV